MSTFRMPDRLCEGCIHIFDGSDSDCPICGRPVFITDGRVIPASRKTRAQILGQHAQLSVKESKCQK